MGVITSAIIAGATFSAAGAATVAGSLASILGTAAAIGSAAAIGYGVSSAITGPRQAKKAAKTQADIAKSQMPALPGGVTDPTAAAQATRIEAEQTVAAATKERKKAIARSRTVFTSPLGLQEEALTAKKTLLGR